MNNFSFSKIQKFVQGAFISSLLVVAVVFALIIFTKIANMNPVRYFFVGILNYVLWIFFIIWSLRLIFSFIIKNDPTLSLKEQTEQKRRKIAEVVLWSGIVASIILKWSMTHGVSSDASTGIYFFSMVIPGLIWGPAFLIFIVINLMA
jgi:uncharacterized membrane protein